MHNQYDLNKDRLKYECDNSEGRDTNYEYLSLEFNDPTILAQLDKSRQPGVHNVIAEGSAYYELKMSQIGSPWDADEAVVGVQKRWTVSGLFSVNISFDDNHKLTKFDFDKNEPFVDPYTDPKFTNKIDVSPTKKSFLSKLLGKK